MSALMTAQKLLLDRVEFTTIKVSADVNDGKFEMDKSFPQLNFDFSPVVFETKSTLGYPEGEAEDPRYFILTYGVRALSSDQKEGITLPYEVEVEAMAFFRYVGGDEFVGANRFRAVRFSGYQILYGAIREMVCNLTARGRHGMMHLPARNFGVVAQTRAEDDEKERLALVEARSAKAKKVARKRTVKLPAAGSESQVKN